MPPSRRPIETWNAVLVLFGLHWVPCGFAYLVVNCNASTIFGWMLYPHISPTFHGKFQKLTLRKRQHAILIPYIHRMTLSYISDREENAFLTLAKSLKQSALFLEPGDRPLPTAAQYINQLTRTVNKDIKIIIKNKNMNLC